MEENIFNIVIGSEANHQSIDDLKKLFRQYDDYIFRTQGLKAETKFFEEELGSLPGYYSIEQKGEFFLAYQNDLAIGCTGIIRYDDETCLLKRMFVLEKFQGNGLGRNLLDIALNKARKLGYKFMRFDSLRGLDKALKLYETYGFREINSVHLNPYYPNGKLPPNAILMELCLIDN